KIAGYAIWEPDQGYATISYEDILFTDPENDPRSGTYQWTLTHEPKFINHQGISSLDGDTLSSRALHLDKVGRYEIALRAYDDPGLEAYREASNPYMQSVIVHRRPIANFS